MHETESLSLQFGRLEVRAVLQGCLLRLHLLKYLILQVTHVRGFNFQCKLVQLLESLCIRHENTFSDHVLPLGLLAIPNLLLNTPGSISSPDNVPIACQSRENGHPVDSELSHAHKEIVDVTVFSLHHNLCQHSRQLLLLRRNQGRHRERAHCCLHERSHNQLEDVALLQDEVVCLLLCLINHFLGELEAHAEASTLTVTLNEDLNCSVLYVESNRVLCLVNPVIFGVYVHHVLPVEQADVLYDLSSIDA